MTKSSRPDTGDVFVFQATNVNTGVLVINGKTVVVRRDGKPVRAGDLEAGVTYDVDPETGELRHGQD